MPGMSSMEEDALFTSYGWTKNLIKRQYESPYGQTLSFDDVVDATQSAAGEEVLRQVVRRYGVKQTDR